MSWPNWTGNVRRRWWGRMEAQRTVRCIDKNGKGYDLEVWTPIDHETLRQILKQSFRDAERLERYQSKISGLRAELKALRE